MKRMTHKSDMHLYDAVEYAKSHQPCVISCHTVVGMEAARERLLVRGKVSFIRVSTRGYEREQQFQEFERGVTDFLVIASQLLYVGGIRFKRPDVCIASADALTEMRAEMLHARLRMPDLGPVLDQSRSFAMVRSD